MFLKCRTYWHSSSEHCGVLARSQVGTGHPRGPQQAVQNSDGGPGNPTGPAPPRPRPRDRPQGVLSDFLPCQPLTQKGPPAPDPPQSPAVDSTAPARWRCRAADSGGRARRPPGVAARPRIKSRRRRTPLIQTWGRPEPPPGTFHSCSFYALSIFV